MRRSATSRLATAFLPWMALTVIAVTAAAGAEYPSRAVDVIVPFAAGGGTDVLARILSEGLSKRLGQSFVVLNRPGANTNIGTQAAVRAPPDGYTLVMASIGLTANPSLYRKLPFAPLADLAPISLIANAPTILVVNPSLPVNSLPDLIAYLKSKPHEVAYGSYGAGSGPHLAAALFEFTTGTKMLHVPYGGGAPAAYAVVGNNVQMLFSSVLPVLGLIRSGSVRPIAVAADHRLALLPDVPTFLELGVTYKTGTWFGLLAPAKTPDAVVARLQKACAEAVASDGYKSASEKLNATARYLPEVEFKAMFESDSAHNAEAVKKAGITQ